VDGIGDCRHGAQAKLGPFVRRKCMR
jgi:hypothetical protein